MNNAIAADVIHPTRFREIGYTHDAPRIWRFVDMQCRKPDGSQSRIGPIHPTKESLLADLDRFAAVYGCG